MNAITNTELGNRCAKRGALKGVDGLAGILPLVKPRAVLVWLC